MGNIQRYTPVTLYPKAPLYDIIIIADMHGTIGRNEISNTKCNEIKNIAILPLWHACSKPARRQDNVRGIRNVKIARFENIVLLLHPHVDVPYSLVVT